MPDASEPLRIWCNFPFYDDLQQELRARPLLDRIV